MAKNQPKGDNARVGAIKERSQTIHSDGRHWLKRDINTGQFLDLKTSSEKPFKGVRKEK
jgi:hypothetical protein